MPAKKAAAKKSKKTGSTKKTSGKASRKKTTASRSTVASRKKVTKRSAKKTGSKKKTGKSAGVSRKKGTSKKAPSTKAAAKKKPAARKKPASKKNSPVSKKKPVSKKRVVAKPASSRKKTPSQPAATRKSSTKSAPAPKRAPTTQAAAPSKKRTPVAAQPTAPSAKRPPAPRVARTDTAKSALSGPVRGFQPYQPKRGEPYMSDEQLEHFRHILLAWKRELMEEVDRTVLHMKDDAANFPDPNDRATQESEFGLELRTRDRERKLLKKIDSALQRIDDRSYGYCEETGDEIGLRRLEARPVATLCVEAQERRELAERQFRDREDYYR
jgi:DnaK suppressor protein